MADDGRRILHCDMDCFYAAVHMRDDPSLRGKPVVIGGSPQGRGVIAAASYEARAYGLHSAMPAARAVRQCPHAVFIRPEFPRYRRESEAIFAILREITPIVQPASLDEAYLDVTDALDRFGSATAAAQTIRRRVWEERRLTVSVGVAPNKLVAKIASDFRKPDGLTVVRPGQVRDFLAPMPVRRLHGVGPATEAALTEMGVRTIADLRRVPSALLRARFGQYGGVLHAHAHGDDDRPVRTHRDRKSLGHERTYARDLADLDAKDAELARLATKVAEGLHERELSAQTLTIKVRYSDFTTRSRSRSLPFPTAVEARIAGIAQSLLRTTEAVRRPVRLLGVTAANLVPGAPEQLQLFADADGPIDDNASGAI
ncbi:MAG: DNA polymerase IV [Acidobacteriota bacterium]